MSSILSFSLFFKELSLPLSFCRKYAVLCRLFVGVKSRLGIAVGQHKLLHALPSLHLSGVDVALRIHRDRIDPMKIPGHASVVPNRSGHLSSLAVLNPHFIVRSVRDERVFSVWVVSKRKVINRAAHAIHRA